MSRLLGLLVRFLVWKFGEAALDWTVRKVVDAVGMSDPGPPPDGEPEDEEYYWEQADTLCEELE